VFVATESDHFRSRLTHTLEVAQISRHLARILGLNEDLCEAIALAHDLGHTPFGHAGEREMNRLMQDHGGFEHNVQSLRVVDVLETRRPEYRGLNLSKEVRDGLLKYPAAQGATYSPTLEAAVVNIADEIAYNNHDLDDGLAAGLLSEAELEVGIPLWAEAKQAILRQTPSLAGKYLWHQINSYLITTQIDDVVRTVKGAISRHGLNSHAGLADFPIKDIGFSSQMKAKNQILRRYLFDALYTHYKVYRMNKKGQHLISGLFQAFHSDPKLLPPDYKARAAGDGLERAICDYIAGMSDVYAQKEHREIYGNFEW
jgi:dGTPase